MLTGHDWEDLESERTGHGTIRRRLYPDSPHDLFIAVQHPDDVRMLALRVDGRAAERALRLIGRLPTSAGLDLRFARLTDGRSEMQVVLTAAELREVFNPLADDIAVTVRDAPGPVEAVLAAVNRFEHWRHLLRSVSDAGLTPEARRGLYGELRILSDHLLPGLATAEAAVRAWTGPTGANQDFQLAAAAIEVKTSSAKQPQTLVITNERELDNRGIPTLILAHLSVDERRGGDGESLNSAVDRLRSEIVKPVARAHFDDLLIRVGYLASHRGMYDEPRYTLRERHLWRVTGDFPRITEADLRTGVGDCRYRISTAGLDAYLLTGDELAVTLREADA